MKKSKKLLAIFALAVITLAVTACNNPFFPKPRELNPGERETDTSLAVAIAVDVDGRDVTLTAIVTGSGWEALSYQWYSNGFESSEGGAPIPGETEESYEPPTETPGTTYYYVKVSTGRNAVAVSNTVKVIVKEEGEEGYEDEPVTVEISAPVAAPAVTIAAETDEDGRKVTLTAFATVSDEGTLRYQWYRSATDRSDRGTALPGETSTTYTPPVTSNGTVYYYVRATNTLRGQTASAASHTVKVTVQDGEVIEVIVSDTVEKPSVSVTASVSGGVTLTATASVSDGGTLSYRWYKSTSEGSGGGTPIVGATEITYEPAPGSDGTVYYYVKVTNTLKGQTVDAVSNTVKIVTRYGEIVITEIVVSATAETPSVNVSAANDGGYVTITAAASVSDGGTLSYRWYKNTVDNNKNGALIADATETIYTPWTDVVGTAYYYVKVTNTLDGQTAEATSVTVRVIVQSGGITEVIVSEAVKTPVVSIAAAVSGRTVTIMAAASAGDGGTLSYRWYHNEENSAASGTLINGVTGIIYAPPTDTVGTAYYYVEVTNSLNGQTASVASNTVRVTVPAGDGAIEVETFHIDIPAVVIDADVDGRDVTITAAASVSDGGTLTYQWYRNSKRSINSGAAIDGATGETYDPPTDTVGVLYYYVKVTNTLKGRTATATSNIIGVTVPAGDGAIEILNVETSDADIPAVSITAAVTGRSVTIMASASVDDGGMLSYQWYRNEENNKNGMLIGGAMGILYAPPTDHPGITYYYVSVTNTVNGQTASALSNTVGVVVPSGNGAIEIIETLDVEPPTVSIDADVTGRIVTITADAFVNDGGTLSYRWYRNTQRNTTGGTLIPGETGATYMPPTDNIGTVYTVYYYARVTNALNGKTASATSNIVGVTVPADNGAIQVETFDVDIPTVTIAAAVTGRSVTITAAASVGDGGTLSYQWYRNEQNNKNGTVIDGATGIIYAPPTGVPGTIYYYVVVTNTLHGKTAVATSNTIGVVVPAGTGSIGIIETLDVETPTVSLAANVNGTNVTLTVTATVNDGGALSYRWYSNTQKSAAGGAEIAGETGTTYMPPTDTAGVMYYYVHVTNTLNGKTAGATSNLIGVTVPEGAGAIQIDTSEVDTPVVTIAAAVTGRSVTIIAAASVRDGGALSYQWYRNTQQTAAGGTEIPNATSITYAPPTGVPGTTYYYVRATNTLNGKTAYALSNVIGVVVPQEGGTIDLLEVETDVEIPVVTVEADLVGTTVTLRATATVNDGGVITYLWYSNDQRNKDGTEIAGATGMTYVAPTDTLGTIYYYCLATNTLNGHTARSTSNIVGVTVPDNGNIEVIEAEIPVVTATASPSPGPYRILQTVTLTAANQLVTDGGIVTYQWYMNNTNSIIGGTLITGATANTYMAPTTSVNTTYYYVRATNTLLSGKNAGAESNVLEIEVVVTQIDRVSVGVTAPAKGTDVTSHATTNDPNAYELGNVIWSTGGTAFTGETFAAETVYTATITLTAKTGYAFNTDTEIFTATMGGATTVTNLSAQSVTLSRTYAATLNKNVTAVTIASQPTKDTYYHGEALNLDGLTLKVTYDTADTDGNYDVTGSLDQLNVNVSITPYDVGEKVKRGTGEWPVAITVGNATTPVYTNNLTITAKDLFVTRVSHTKVYDATRAAGTNDFTEIAFTGREFTDDVSVSTVDGVYTNTAAGTQTMTINGGTLAGTDASTNYRLRADYDVPVTGGITTATPTLVTWPTGLTASYGTGTTTLSSISLASTNGRLTGVTGADLTGTFTWDAPSTNVGDAGPRLHSMTFTPVSANYHARTGEASITVNNKPVTVTVGTPNRTLSPVDASATFTVTVAGMVSGHSVNVYLAGTNIYGLTLSNNTYVPSGGNVTLNYNDTAVTETTPLSVGLTITAAPTNNYYTIPSGSTVAPLVCDGRDNTRRIPVTQQNIVRSETGFNDYARTANGLTRHYKLAEDITLNSTNNWTPIGTQGTNNTFRGSFDGQKFTITNLTINSTAHYVGMFGYTAGNSLISNVGLRNISVTSTGNIVGGVIGYAAGSITYIKIQNCFVTGSVSGGSTVGGVVGYLNGIMQNCYSTANVTGSSSVGGVVGSTDRGSTIRYCYATGAVSSTSTSTNAYTGGVAGTVNGGTTITNCVAFNSSITIAHTNNAYIGRIYAPTSGESVATSYNYGGALSMTYGGGPYYVTSATASHNGKDGEPMSALANNSKNPAVASFWTTSSNWNPSNSFSNVWDTTNVWDITNISTNGGRPLLRGFTAGMQ